MTTLTSSSNSQQAEPGCEYFQIVNKRTGKCMKLGNVNDRILQFTCGTGNVFLWKRKKNNDDGTYIITSKIGNYVWDSYGGVTWLRI
jgi:hypothetical protein